MDELYENPDHRHEFKNAADQQMLIEMQFSMAIELLSTSLYVHFTKT